MPAQQNNKCVICKLVTLVSTLIDKMVVIFNKIDIHDDDKWFDNVFVTGPGFQIAQIFVESIFDGFVTYSRRKN